MTATWMGTVRPGAEIENPYRGARYFRALTFTATGQTLRLYQELFGKVVAQLKGTKVRTYRVDIGLPVEARMTGGELFCEGKTVPMQVVYLRHRAGEGFQVGLRSIRLNGDFSTELFRNWCLENSRGVKFLKWSEWSKIDCCSTGVYLEFDPPLERGPFRESFDGRFFTGANIASLNAGEIVQTIELSIYQKRLRCSVDFFAVLPHLLKAVTEKTVFTALGAEKIYDFEDRKYTINAVETAALSIHGGAIAEGVDYEAVGALFVPKDQVDAVLEKIKSGHFKFRLSMEKDDRLKGDWGELLLVSELVSKPFLAVPVE